ncbi:MAG: hypothetical protein M3Y87_10430, partial [Myxococcota bacterium]|nr:hypothetical protein [Myxococcota bacterium]
IETEPRAQVPVPTSERVVNAPSVVAHDAPRVVNVTSAVAHDEPRADSDQSRPLRPRMGRIAIRR